MWRGNHTYRIEKMADWLHPHLQNSNWKLTHLHIWRTADIGRKNDISEINPATLPNFVLKKRSQFEDHLNILNRGSATGFTYFIARIIL